MFLFDETSNFLLLCSVGLATTFLAFSFSVFVSLSFVRHFNLSEISQCSRKKMAQEILVPSVTLLVLPSPVIVAGFNPNSIFSSPRPEIATN